MGTKGKDGDGTGSGNAPVDGAALFARLVPDAAAETAEAWRDIGRMAVEVYRGAREEGATWPEGVMVVRSMFVGLWTSALDASRGGA